MRWLLVQGSALRMCGTTDDGMLQVYIKGKLVSWWDFRRFWLEIPTGNDMLYLFKHLQLARTTWDAALAVRIYFSLFGRHRCGPEALGMPTVHESQWLEADYGDVCNDLIMDGGRRTMENLGWSRKDSDGKMGKDNRTLCMVEQRRLDDTEVTTETRYYKR